ncbi:hypothetical protein ACFL21_05440, partial [Patescibacteria group bacterium]
ENLVAELAEYFSSLVFDSSRIDEEKIRSLQATVRDFFAISLNSRVFDSTNFDYSSPCITEIGFCEDLRALRYQDSSHYFSFPAPESMIKMIEKIEDVKEKVKFIMRQIEVFFSTQKESSSYWGMMVALDFRGCIKANKEEYDKWFRAVEDFKLYLKSVPIVRDVHWLHPTSGPSSLKIVFYFGDVEDDNRSQKI